VIAAAIMVMVVMVTIAPMSGPIVVAAAQRQPDREQSGGDGHFCDTHDVSPYNLPIEPRGRFTVPVWR
jgi:hypothetical protein